MNSFHKRGHSIDIIFVLCLFLVFTITLLNVLFLGATVYQNISKKSNQNYNARTSLLYLSNKIKAYDGTNAISIGEFGGGDAIFLEEKIDGGSYVTKIYAYDGHLMELFMEKSNTLEPIVGSEIMDITSFEAEKINDKLIKLTVSLDEEKEKSIFINLH